jgi:hypothetical protein
MKDLKPGMEGEAHFEIRKYNCERGVTAFVRITKVNDEYVLFTDNDEINYKVLKDKFLFVKNNV